MSTDKVQPESDEDPESGPQRYKRLPARVRLEDTVETKDTRVPPDPKGVPPSCAGVLVHRVIPED